MENEEVKKETVENGGEKKGKPKYDMAAPEHEQKIDESHLIKTIVIASDWEEVLSNIIEEENINPWDVDIVKLVDAFMKYLYNIKKFDFRVPARFVLIAAILLRLKCEALIIREQKEKQEKPVEIDVNVPIIDMPAVRIPKKKVTLVELVDALNKAVAFTEKKTERKLKARKAIENLLEPVEDIELRIERVYNEIKSRDVRKFSDLVKGWERHEIVDKFIPLLHLANEGRLFCDQKELFGEIFISTQQPSEINVPITSKEE